MAGYLLKTGDLDGLEHVPGPPDQTLGNQFVSRCRCGLAGKSGSTPSAAYKATQEHADAANAPKVSPAASSFGPAPEPRPSIPRPRPAPSGALNECGCGCGETCKGTFRPGHDAKLLGRLGREVASRSLTIAGALEQLAVWPKLKAKLESRLAAAGVKM